MSKENAMLELTTDQYIGIYADAISASLTVCTTLAQGIHSDESTANRLAHAAKTLEALLDLIGYAPSNAIHIGRPLTAPSTIVAKPKRKQKKG